MIKKTQIKNMISTIIKLLKGIPLKVAHLVRQFAGRHPQVFISLCIILTAVLAAYILKISRRPPQRVEQPVPPPLVEVMQAKIEDIQMVVHGYGTVKPKVDVQVVPQVSGRIVFVNPQFEAGGFIDANEALVKIDPRDYELAVQQANAFVAEAQVKLDMEKAEAQVARQEWEELNPNTEPASALVLREPQIRQAKAQLESAKARLATARLSLERTEVSLPVDVLVVSESVDLGQYVVTGQTIGVAYGIDSVEIEVPLEDSELEWLDISNSDVSFNNNVPSNKSTIAEVRADFAGANHTRIGYVRRTTGQVDKTSRLVNVVIEVSEPFKGSDGRPSLLPGTFVEVSIKGSILKNAVAVPRDAVREGNKVWVVENGQLHIQTLDVARSDQDFAYVTSGLDDEATIVLSSLDMATEGMKVRTSSEIPTGTGVSQDSNDTKLMETE